MSSKFLFALTFITTASLSYIGGTYTKKHWPSAVTSLPVENSSSVDSSPIEITVKPKRAGTSKVTDSSRPELAAAIEKIVNESQPLKRSRLLTRFINQCEAKDLIASIGIVASSLNPEEQIEWLTELIPALAETDPKTASEYIPQIEDPRLREDLVEIIATNWMILDSEKAIEWVQQLPTGFNREEIFQEAVRTLAKSNVQTALTVVEKLDPEKKNQNFMRFIYSEWVRQNRSEAIQSLLSMPNPKSFHRVWSDVLRIWAEKEPSEAAQFILENKFIDQSNDTGGTSLLATIIHKWAQNDLEKAFTWTQELSDTKAREQALKALIREMSEHDPARAARIISGFKGRDAGGYYHAIADNWAKKNVQEALEWANTIPTENRLQTISSIMYRWSRVDPLSAATYVTDILKGQEQQSAIITLASQWGQKDPQAALLWVMELPPGNNQQNALQNVVQQWAGSDPRAVAEYSKSIPEGPEQEKVVTTLVNAWIQNDPREAVAFANAMPEQTRVAALQSALIFLSQRSSQEAVECLSLLPSDTQASILPQVISQISYSNPQLASTWAHHLHDTKEKNETYSRISQYWVQSDEPAAYAWLDSLPTGEARDAAVGGYASGLVGVEPEKAIRAIEMISDPKKKQDSSYQVLSNWFYQDPENAKPWVQKSSLTEQQKQQLLSLEGQLGKMGKARRRVIVNPSGYTGEEE